MTPRIWTERDGLHVDAWGCALVLGIVGFFALMIAIALGASGCVPVVDAGVCVDQVAPATAIALPEQCTEDPSCSDDGERPWRTACGRWYVCEVENDPDGRHPLECMNALDCECLAAFEACAPDLAATIEADTPAWCLEKRKAAAS